MNILTINVYSNYTNNNKNNITTNTQNSLNKHSSINLNNTFRAIPLYNIHQINFNGRENKKTDFELNYSTEELNKRLSKSAYTPYNMLGVDSPQYKNLADGDKEALKHLVKAAMCFNAVHERLDNAKNKDFREYLDTQIKKGNEQAFLTKKLYDGQKGIIGKDYNNETVILAKGFKPLAGKGFYPEDLDEKEFHTILKTMLKNNKTEEVKNILNQRSLVFRNGDKLKSIDYTEYFKDEFSQASKELYLAAKSGTNKEFSEYLMYQIDALQNASPKLDAKADKAWAKLQYTPLEFTIGRECYDDKLTPTVTKDRELMDLLKKHNITPCAKDTLGVRVGIVNKKGTDYILNVKKHLPMLAEKMPFNDQYTQVISSEQDSKQTMVDADIVAMTGMYGRFRGTISLASNLPNPDKLAVQQDGGFRNVYHIQCRKSKYGDNMNKVLDALLDKSQHKYYDVNSLHDFTILHENIHTLGPKKGLEALGTYKNTIEEHKADAGALVMLDELTKEGFYTPLKKKQFITSYMIAYTLKSPDFDNAHRARNILQHNYFIEHGAVNITKEGKMKIDYDKVIDCAHKMLENAVEIQLSRDPKKAREYIEENAIWSDKLEMLGKNLKSVDKKLNSYVVMPLAEQLINE